MSAFFRTPFRSGLVDLRPIEPVGIMEANAGKRSMRYRSFMDDRPYYPARRERSTASCSSFDSSLDANRPFANRTTYTIPHCHRLQVTV